MFGCEFGTPITFKGTRAAFMTWFSWWGSEQILGTGIPFSAGTFQMSSGFSTGRCVYPLKEITVSLGTLEIQSAGVPVGVGHAHVQVSVTVTFHSVQGDSHVVGIDLTSG